MGQGGDVACQVDGRIRDALGGAGDVLGVGARDGEGRQGVTGLRARMAVPNPETIATW